MSNCILSGTGRAEVSLEGSDVMPHFREAWTLLALHIGL